MGNVIPFRLDPGYFFDRALRYLDRHDLGRAKRFFERAVEYEPDNAANHCNLAGVLSEMGQYEASNEILRTVLTDIDENMAECHFYMANNFAHLEAYDLAEEYALRYLELDPDGELSEEAVEMIDILVKEYGGGRVLRAREEEYQRELEKRDYARRLLEVGKFREAIDQLQIDISASPEDLSIRNNLALAYYYIGDTERALKEAWAVIEADPANIHARCNLAVFYQHMDDEEHLAAMLSGLRKTYPMNPDHLHKLAMTMGLLGEHEVAYSRLRLLLQFNFGEHAVKHALAAAACHVGKVKVAERLWHELLREDSESGVARFYLDRLEECRELGIELPWVSYQYAIPFHEQFRALRHQLEGDPASGLKADPMFRSSLLWSLFNGDIETKIQVIQTMALMPDEEVVAALREFVRSPEEIDQLKRLAVFVLSKISGRDAAEAVYDNQSPTKWLRTAHPQAREWRLVIDRCAERIREHYGDAACDRARQKWMLFLSKLSPRAVRLGRWEGWAAGLEYVVLRELDIPVRQIDVAKAYGVSVCMVSRRAKLILDPESQP